MKIPFGAKVYHRGRLLRPGDELDDKIAKELGVPEKTKASEAKDKADLEKEKSGKIKRDKHKPSESKQPEQNRSEQNRVEI